MSRDENQRLFLPSGALAIRVFFGDDRNSYYALHDSPVRLTFADVEALYADSIAGDGGRELARVPSRARWAHPPCKTCGHGDPHWIAAGQDICTAGCCDCECYVAQVQP